MNINDYNEHLKISLVDKHPAVLLPVRLETRYVKSGTIRHPLEAVLDDALISTDVPVNSQQLKLAHSPTKIFEGGLQLVRTMRVLDKELRGVNKNELTEPAFYKLSILESRVAGYSANALRALRESSVIQKEYNAWIEKAIQTIEEKARFQVKETAPTLPKATVKGLKKAGDALLDISQSWQTLESLKADAFMARQVQLSKQIEGWLQLVSLLPELNEDDYRIVEEQNRAISTQLKKWNEASDTTIKKFEALPEVLDKKLSNIRTLLDGYQKVYVSDAGFGELGKIWQQIDRLHIEGKRLKNAPSFFAALNLDDLLASVAALYKDLTKANLKSLHQKVLQDLAEGISDYERFLKEIVDDTLQKNSACTGLLGVLQLKTKALTRAVNIDDCEEGHKIPSGKIHIIYRLKDHISSLLEEIRSHDPRNFTYLYQALSFLIKDIDTLRSLLNSIWQADCNDCQELEALLESLPVQIDHTISNLIEALIKENKGLEATHGLIKQIRSQLAALSTLIDSTKCSIYNKSREIKSLIAPIWDASQNHSAKQLINLVNNVHEQVRQLTSNLPPKKNLPSEWIHILTGIWGELEAIVVLEWILQSRLDSLRMEKRAVDSFQNTLHSIANLKTTNCKSDIYEQVKKELESLVLKINEDLEELRAQVQLPSLTVSRLNADISESIARIIGKINTPGRINQKDLRRIMVLSDQAIRALKKWEKEILAKISEKEEQNTAMVKSLGGVSQQAKRLGKYLCPPRSKLVSLRFLKAFQKLSVLNQREWTFSDSCSLEFLTLKEETLQDLCSLLGKTRELSIPLEYQVTSTLLNLLQEQRKKNQNGLGLTAPDMQNLASNIERIHQLLPLKSNVAPQENDHGKELHDLLLTAENSMSHLLLAKENLPAITRQIRELATILQGILTFCKRNPKLSRRAATVLNKQLEDLIDNCRTWLRELEPKLNEYTQRLEHIRQKDGRLLSLLAQTNRLIKSVEVINPVRSENDASPSRQNAGKRSRAAEKTLFVKAYWIEFQQEELWIRVFPDDISIDAHDPAITQEEKESAKYYWEEVWDYFDDQEKHLGYWRMLVNRFGAERAAYITHIMKPEQQGDNLVFPTNIPTKRHSWSKAQVSYIMPDRFVFVLYPAGSDDPISYHFGNDIPAELAVGIDPADEDALRTTASGDLTAGDSIRWMISFSDAVAKGMAIRIPFDGPSKNFSKIIALGFKTQKPAEESSLIDYSQNLLEKLFEGHQYGPGGLSFVPPGTPTNNTSDTTSGYQIFQDAESAYAAQIAGAHFTEADQPEDRTDGETLAEALGINRAVFRSVQNASGFTIKNASVINSALWNATLGYFLEEAFTFFNTGDHLFNTLQNDDDSFPEEHNMVENLDRIRDYFVDYVKGRGALPSIRVGNQPYGILPIGIFHQGAYEFGEDDYEVYRQTFRPFFQQPEEGDTDFYKLEYDPDSLIPIQYGGLFKWADGVYSENFMMNLLNILLGIKSNWVDAVLNKVKTVDDSFDEGEFNANAVEKVNERFIKIAGLHANAASYYRRYAIGSGDERLMEEVFEDHETGFLDNLGLRETDFYFYLNSIKLSPLMQLFFPGHDPSKSLDNPSPPPKTYYHLTSLRWIWGKNIPTDDEGAPTTFDFSSDFLSIAHLRYLNDEETDDTEKIDPNQLTGNTVDRAKPSEKRALSALNSDKNYIDWLLDSPVKSIIKASVEGNLPSNSLLCLLLSQSLLNGYWDAAMRIYENMGVKSNENDPNLEEPLGLTLRQPVFTALPKELFPQWNFVGSTWNQVKDFVNNQLETYEEKKQAAGVLNVVIDFGKLYDDHPYTTNSCNNFFITQEEQRYLFDINEDEKLEYRHIHNIFAYYLEPDDYPYLNFESKADTFISTSCLLNNLILSDYCFELYLDRRNYKSFAFEWGEKFIEGIKHGADLYWYNELEPHHTPADGRIDNSYDTFFNSKNPADIAGIINRTHPLNFDWQYQFVWFMYYASSSINKVPNNDNNSSNDDTSSSNDENTEIESDNPSDWRIKDGEKPIEYVVKYVNSRLPFLLHKLKEGDVPNIVPLPANNIVLGLDNSMADYLKREETFATYPSETEHLRKMRSDLAILKELPTAELERLMAEHVDLCSHRLDAWLLSLVNRALSAIRSEPATENGSYIGAYGYLIDLEKKAEKRILAADGSDITVDAIGAEARNLIAEDKGNLGFIHAPSIHHATTAAVLRAAYEATDADANTAFEINLESRRVKQGLWLLDGIRNGQPLGALLGYQLERSLHEYSLDKYIYDLRGLFPLVSDTLIPNADQAVETVAAGNVIDGLRLLEIHRLLEAGISGEFPELEGDFSVFLAVVESNEELDRVKLLISEMEDYLDAVSDLVISESVFQAAKGNYERAGAVQKAFNEGAYIPESEIVNTPRTGHPVTHRVGVLIDAGDLDTSTPGWPGIPTPRAKAEPALNRWLGQQVGAAVKLGFTVTYKEPNQPDLKYSRDATLANLNVQPIDLISLINAQSYTQDSELSRLIKWVMLEKIKSEVAFEPILDSVHVNYEISPVPGSIPLCDKFPLLQVLAKILADSTYLSSEHLVHPATLLSLSENSSLDLDDLSFRVNKAYDVLGNNGLKAQLAAAKEELENNSEGSTDDLRGLLIQAFLFGITEAIPPIGSLVNERSALLQRSLAVLEAIQRKIAAWESVDQPTSEDSEIIAEGYVDRAKIIFGESFRILPVFTLLNPEEFNLAREGSSSILPANKPMIMETWLGQMGRVREKIGQLEMLTLYQDMNLSFEADEVTITPLQLPYRPNDHWIGDEIPEDYFKSHKQDEVQVSRDKLSLVLLFDVEEENLTARQKKGFGPNQPADRPYAGLLVDEWNEVIPNREETTGIAYHYDQPNAEAPQSILLTVPPVEADYSLEYFLDTINTAFEMAKIRAVAPEDLAESLAFDFVLKPVDSTYGNPYETGLQKLHLAHLFPGILARVSDFSKEMDISLDFITNNKGENEQNPLFPSGTFDEEEQVTEVPEPEEEDDDIIQG